MYTEFTKDQLETLEKFKCTPSITVAIHLLVNNPIFTLSNNYLIWHENNTAQQPAQSEIDDMILRIKAYNGMYELRNFRNKLLNKTDIYMIQDYPISIEDKNLIIEYRQKLRDLPNTYKGIDIDINNIETYLPSIEKFNFN